LRFAMARYEVDLIGEAITATEKEIAGAAWGNEEPVLDETGDKSLETMGEGLEGQHEPDEDDDDAEGDETEADAESEEGEGEAEGETEPAAAQADAGKEKPEAAEVVPDSRDRVPAKRLREQTERTRAVEAERDALRAQLAERETKHTADIATLNGRFDQLAAALRQPAAKPPGEADAKPAAPDFFEDPAGFLAAQTKPLTDTVSQLRGELAAQRVETSMAIAHGKHGDAFAKAYEAVTRLNPQNPDDQITVRRIYGSPNPGEALVAWHKRNEALRVVGDDPAAYAEKLRTETRESLMKDPEFRKALLADLQAEASRGADGRPNTITRLPRSLNGAAGGNRREAADAFVNDGSDQAIADSAWR
jgi:hypothetical protein